MLNIWDIEYYVENSSQSPVFKFIEQLSPSSKTKIINSIDLLSEFGVNLKYPYVDKIEGTNLRELRILGKDNIRILSIAIHPKIFLLLHGFIKKTE